MLKFMLDTNTCIFTIKNKPEHIRERFNLNTSRMCISSITLMELIYGAEKAWHRSVILQSWRDLSPALRFWITIHRQRYIPVKSVPNWPAREHLSGLMTR